jgi:chromosome partitioning protein
MRRTVTLQYKNYFNYQSFGYAQSNTTCHHDGCRGVGKTTLAANLGYEVARLGHRVVIFDLDPQGSLNVACRLSKTPAPKATTAWIYSGFFDGTYTLIPVWEQHVSKLEVFQGGSALFKIMPNLTQAGGSYLLQEALSEYPLTHDLIILIVQRH